MRAAFQKVVTLGYGVAKVFQFYLNTIHCKFSLCLLGAEARLARKPECLSTECLSTACCLSFRDFNWLISPSILKVCDLLPVVQLLNRDSLCHRYINSSKQSYYTL